MNQLAIDFAAPRARARDPKTSHDAAKRAERFAQSHKGRIVAAMREQHPMPLDAYQIGILSGLTLVQVDRRLCELQREGLIEPTGAVVDGYRVWRLL